jgi:putative transcriptional regulator
VLRLNPAAYKNKPPVKRWVRLFLIVFLILQAAPVLGPEPSAESAGRNPAKLIFEAAIPKKVPGAPGPREELAKGKFLVASRRLLDPNFREAVVLLVEYGLDGAMGLVINRPSKVKLTAVFPDIKELKDRKDTIFIGGPVAVNRMMMLIRSSRVPEASKEITQDVYMSSSWKVLERLMKNTVKDETFRLFAGYAGWAPDQLDFERTRGDWHVLKADTEAVFSQNPSALWPELIQRVTAKWVRTEHLHKNLN